MKRHLIVPAAGLGTRLRSNEPKVLTRVAGRPMIDHVLTRQGRFCSDVTLVVHPSFHDQVERHCRAQGYKVGLVVQVEPTGMLDAILLAAAAAEPSRPDRCWITWCDQVAVHQTTLARLDAIDRDEAPDVALPVCPQHEPYIHIERDRSGQIVGVRQRREGDAMPDEGESDAGLFSLSAKACFADLPAFARTALAGARTGERAFLPFLASVARDGRVATFPVTDPIEARGINTPEDLAAIDAYFASEHPLPS